MITTTLRPGDRVRDTYYNDSDEGRGVVMAHPLIADGIIVVFRNHAMVFFSGNPEKGDFDRDWIVIDDTREVWDRLDASVREMLRHTTKTKKIVAIKALRALTGLGLTDAKRAIESDWP